MVITDFKYFPRSGRLLGIDWGSRRIGIAISDESRGFIFPRGIIPESEILRFIKDENVVGVVIGLPLYADGGDSDTTRKVREFAEKLAEGLTIPIVFIEENLTSIEANERQHAKGKRQKEIDSESAAVILENAISMMKRTANV